jgi:hypothetical protein
MILVLLFCFFWGVAAEPRQLTMPLRGVRAVGREGCGVRFHLHGSFMAASSREAREQRVLALMLAANETFSRGGLFDMYIHEILHDAVADPVTSDSFAALRTVEAETAFDHAACANVWLMHQPFAGSVVGVAWVGGACNSVCHGTQHVAIVSVPPVGDAMQHLVDEAWVLAHELGHLVGARHVAGDTVMNPGVVQHDISAFGFPWDNRSLFEIRAHVRGDCGGDTCLTAVPEKHTLCHGTHCHPHTGPTGGVVAGATLAVLFFLLAGAWAVASLPY